MKSVQKLVLIIWLATLNTNNIFFYFWVSNLEENIYKISKKSMGSIMQRTLKYINL